MGGRGKTGGWRSHEIGVGAGSLSLEGAVELGGWAGIKLGMNLNKIPFNFLFYLFACIWKIKFVLIYLHIFIWQSVVPIIVMRHHEIIIPCVSPKFADLR